MIEIAKNVLIKSLDLKEEEKVTIITDKKTSAIAEAFFNAAKKIAKVEPSIIIMEDYGRPLTYLPKEIEEKLIESEVTLYLAGTQPGELSFRRPMYEASTSNGARHGHAPGINQEIMATGMKADIDACNSTNEDIYNRVKQTEWLHITSEAGTDVKIDLKYKWINSNWDIKKPGSWHNLPSGEVFTAPFNTNGVVVFDGVLGDHFDEKYGSLKNNPVTMIVKENKVIEINCDNKELEEEFKDYVFNNEKGDLIGEIGIGCLKVDSLVNCMLQDEKVLGTIHIAVGSNYHKVTGAPNLNQKTHCDGVIQNVTLMTSKGDILLDKGRYKKKSN